MTSKYRRGIWHRHQPYTNNVYEDLRTTSSPWTWGSFFMVLLGLGFVFGMLMLASAADEKAESDHKKLAQLTKSEQVIQALPTKLAEAYERGLADAMESVNGTPQGVALAQACLAAGVGR